MRYTKSRKVLFLPSVKFLKHLNLLSENIYNAAGIGSEAFISFNFNGLRKSRGLQCLGAHVPYVRHVFQARAVHSEFSEIGKTKFDPTC